MKKSVDSIVESFADVSNDPTETKTAGQYILEIVKKSPKKDWTQKTIREQLLEIDGAAHSNPAINGALRKLADNDEIIREQQSKSVFYRHKPRSKK